MSYVGTCFNWMLLPRNNLGLQLSCALCQFLLTPKKDELKGVYVKTCLLSKKGFTADLYTSIVLPVIIILVILVIQVNDLTDHSYQDATDIRAVCPQALLLHPSSTCWGCCLSDWLAPATFFYILALCLLQCGLHNQLQLHFTSVPQNCLMLTLPNMHHLLSIWAPTKCNRNDNRNTYE